MNDRLEPLRKKKRKITQNVAQIFIFIFVTFFA